MCSASRNLISGSNTHCNYHRSSVFSPKLTENSVHGSSHIPQQALNFNVLGARTRLPRPPAPSHVGPPPFSLGGSGILDRATPILLWGYLKNVLKMSFPRVLRYIEGECDPVY